MENENAVKHNLKLVLQAPYQNCCQQACIAMLTGMPLGTVIAELGDGRLGAIERRLFLASHGVEHSDQVHITEALGDNAIAALMRKYTTMWVTVFSCVESGYGHACILHNGDLYDPYDGVNPHWPWHRYIAQIAPIVWTDHRSRAILAAAAAGR